MFQCVVHKNARDVIATFVNTLPRSVYVVCAGNMTIPSLLHLNGYKGKVYACDVSLYSSSLGFFITRKDFDLQLAETEEGKAFGWLKDGWLDGLNKKAATVALAFEMTEFASKKNLYQISRWDAYLEQWQELHQKTMANLHKFREVSPLEGYEALDPWKVIEKPPPDCCIMSFAPTGNERMFAYLEKVFEWKNPSYEELLSEDVHFYEAIRNSGSPYVVATENRTPEIDEAMGLPISETKRGLRKKIWLYSNVIKRASTVIADSNLEESSIPRITDETEFRKHSKVTIEKITGADANYFRQLFLNNMITPASALWNFGFFIDGKLFGVACFSLSKWGEDELLYMMADLPVETTHPKLSKLVLYCTQSTELKRRLVILCIADFKAIRTTAFSLNEIWKKIKTVDDQLYSGFDSNAIQELVNSAFSAFSAANIQTEVISFWFLPEQAKSVNEILAKDLCELCGEIHAVSNRDIDLMVETILKVKKNMQIKNSALAFSIMVRLANERLEQILEEKE